MNWKISTLNKGDLIRVKRTFYYHFGIYYGDNKVIHFSGEDGDGITESEKVKVILTDINFFAKDGIVEKGFYTFKEKFIRRNNDEIIKIAESRLGEGGYNFLHNNCEDFVYSCAFKKKMKTQVDVLREKINKEKNV